MGTKGLREERTPKRKRRLREERTPKRKGRVREERTPKRKRRLREERTPQRKRRQRENGTPGDRETSIPPLGTVVGVGNPARLDPIVPVPAVHKHTKAPLPAARMHARPGMQMHADLAYVAAYTCVAAFICILDLTLTRTLTRSYTHAK